MKKLSILFLLFSTLCAAQVQLDTVQLRKDRLSRSLAFVSTGNSFSGVGNFASLSTDDKSIKANTFFLTDKNTMITFDAEVGAIQGVGALFSEGQLNSKASFGVNLRFLSEPENAIISSDLDEQLAIQKTLATANAKYQDDLIALSKYAKTQGEDCLFIDEKLVKRTNKIDSLIRTDYSPTQIKAARAYLEDKTKSDSIETQFNSVMQNAYHRDRLENFLIELENLIEQKAKSALTVEEKFLSDVRKLQYERDKKRQEANEKLINLKANSIRLKFWSFGYKASNTRFNLFDEDLTLAKQVIDSSYTTHTLSASWNLITNLRERQGSIVRAKRKFFSAGVALSLTDNLATLDEIEVFDTTVIDSLSGRTTRAKQDAYQGDYETGIKDLITFVDYYLYLSKKDDFVAVHLNPSVRFMDTKKPNTSFQLGLLIPFKKKDEEKVVVGLEIFYRLNDIFNTLESDRSLLGRNAIGLQTSFPFNF